MGQAAKYALLGASLLTVIVSAVAFIQYLQVNETAVALANSVAPFVNTCGDFIRVARGILNTLCGIPDIITMLIWVSIVSPFVKLGLKILVAVVRWLNQ